MKVSDKIFKGNAECRLTFRVWFNVGPNEDVDLSYTDALVAVMRGYEFTKCKDARKLLNRIRRNLLPRFLEEA